MKSDFHISTRFLIVNSFSHLSCWLSNLAWAVNFIVILLAPSMPNFLLYFLNPFCEDQCGQIARLYFQVWPFTTKKNLPNVKKHLPKWVKKLANTKKPFRIAKEFWNCAKVAKLCQIWSHCSWHFFCIILHFPSFLPLTKKLRQWCPLSITTTFSFFFLKFHAS